MSFANVNKGPDYWKALRFALKSEGMDPQLSSAIKANDESALSEALMAGADVNPAGPLRRTPLALAMDGRCDESLIVALIKAGADATEADDSVNPRKSSPLTRACELGMESVAATLLAAGASPEGRFDENGGPLRASSSSEKLTKLLLEAGARPDQPDHAGQTAYMINALFAPKEKVLSYLLDAGADPLARDASGETACQLAAKMWGGLGSCNFPEAFAFLARAEERAILDRAARAGKARAGAPRV